MGNVHSNTNSKSPANIPFVRQIQTPIPHSFVTDATKTKLRHPATKAHYVMISPEAGGAVAVAAEEVAEVGGGASFAASRGKVGYQLLRRPIVLQSSD